MKYTKLILFVGISVLLSSCISASFYQVYKTVPGTGLAKVDNRLVYEDDNCKISYNLWTDGGTSGFQFYNKTTENIYIDLTNCFFIRNGIAYDYYRGRVQTSATNTQVGSEYTLTGLPTISQQMEKVIVSSNSSKAVSVGNSISYAEEKIICVPSRTAKIINEYKISNGLIRSCDLIRFPSAREIKTTNFTEADSPIKFGNRISYRLAEAKEITRLENDFYVSSITNYSEKDIVEKRVDTLCGVKKAYSTKHFKQNDPNAFYVRYFYESNSDDNLPN